MREIERKFLVDEVPHRLDQCDRVHEIRQGYLLSEDSRELRIRRVGHRSRDEITVKKGEGVLRDELTIKVPRSETEHLWDATIARLEKTRYILDVLDSNQFAHLAELDIYKGDLEGLYVVEVEFEEESMNFDEFQPPEWFGREVTNDPDFKNKQLAFKSSRDLNL